MWRKFLIVCILGAIPWHWAAADLPAADAVRRLALVIGNGDYANAPLGNPINDAEAMSLTLRSLGFEVVSYANLSGPRMKEAILDFKRRLEPGGVGLFYFAGHGLQVSGRTLLLPVDADSHSPARMLTRAIDLRMVLQGMAGPRPGKLNLVILDTCLTPPFRTDARLPPPAPERTLIAYATAPGAFAADGRRHGIYTAELLKAMLAPGRDVEEVFRRVEAGVSQATGRRQIPWVSSALPDGFRFVAPTQADRQVLPALPPPEIVTAAQSRGILPKDTAEQYELTFWESIKDSTHPEDYEAYLQAYPKGRFAALARARIERLRAAAPKAEPPPPAKAPPAPATKAAPPEKARPAPAPRAAPPAKPAPSAPPPEKPPSAPAGVREVTDCPTCPTLVELPKGLFTMGSATGDATEKPAHSVSLNDGFAIGKYEVTVEQWNACADAGACPRVSTDANAPKTAPARDVSWDDAQQYVQWLSKTTGKSYRLPTEAEWEYAARGGTTTRYWWGEQMRSGNANCKECGQPWSQAGPANVGSFAANPYGLHDMNGSVWEWVSDCWHSSYKGAPPDGSTWDEPNCRVRVIRGGSWREGASYMMSSTRFKYDANVRQSQNGFRVARNLK